VPSVLLDAGALVAILNRNDHFHTEVTELLKEHQGAILTTWPVVAEACALVRARDQVRVLDWIIGAGIEVVSIDDGADFIRNVMTAYRDLPCDFADASIVYAAWKSRVRDVLTIDKHFLVYRLPDRSRFKVIPGRD
jgi:predicted nucleic acid-binding protein